MIIKNFVHAELKDKLNCHQGIGTVKQTDLFVDSDFTSNLKFINYTVLPVNTSIGNHTHGDNEEIYIIIEGEGKMYVDGEEKKVIQGDIIVNKAFGTHGLINNSRDDLKVLVFEVTK